MTDIQNEKIQPDRPARSLIVARARNGVIGRKGDMPWRLSADLKRFKALTTGKPVIMGRKTWDSLPRKPLPGRANIVVSRNFNFETPGAFLVSGMDTAYAMAQSIAKLDNADEIFVIGGAKLYSDAIQNADRLHITEVQADIEGDTWFPDFDESDWLEVRSETVGKDDKNDYETIYRCVERRG